MTKRLTSLALTSLAATFALYGCGSDSSSNAKSNEKEAGDETIEVESYDDLSACTAKKQGMIVTVTEDETDYYCYATEWIETVASAKKLPDCTAKKEGDMVFISGSEEVAVCQDEEWITAGTDEEDDDDGKSSASKDDGKSSSSGAKESDSKDKVVEFEAGIIWQPSYGKRAWTGAEGVDEYNFNDIPDGANPAKVPGMWLKFLDELNGGESVATGKFNEDNLTLNFELAYFDWSLTTVGTGTSAYSYWEPAVYPYAGFGFFLGEDEPVNIQSISSTGLCVVYNATTPIRLMISTKAMEDSDADFEVTLPASTSKEPVDIKWSNFGMPTWYDGSAPSVGTAVQKSLGLFFVYSNDQAGVTSSCASKASSSTCESYAEASKNSTLKIFKIGAYGACDGSGNGDSDL